MKITATYEEVLGQSNLLGGRPARLRDAVRIFRRGSESDGAATVATMTSRILGVAKRLGFNLTPITAQLTEVLEGTLSERRADFWLPIVIRPQSGDGPENPAVLIVEQVLNGTRSVLVTVRVDRIDVARSAIAVAYVHSLMDGIYTEIFNTAELASTQPVSLSYVHDRLGGEMIYTPETPEEIAGLERAREVLRNWSESVDIGMA